MVGSRTGETYRLGDRVTVKLVEAAPVAGALALRAFIRRTARRGRAASRGTNGAKSNTGRAASNGRHDDATRPIGKVWAERMTKVGARPVVPRQRAARRRDADADRPLRARSRRCCSAAATPATNSCRASSCFRAGASSRSTAQDVGGERIASRHAEETARRAWPTPSAEFARALRARRGARDRRGNRPAARRQTRRAAGDAGRDLGRIRQGARASRTSARSISSPAPSRRRGGRAASTRASSPPMPPRSRTRSRAWWGRIPSWSNSSGCRSRKPPISTCRPSPASCWKNSPPASRPAWGTTCRCRSISWSRQQFFRELL